MTIKAVCFDLDGVLVDADKWHFAALNAALANVGAETISWQEHLTIYKGVPTRIKLPILTERKGLAVENYVKVLELKQKYTLELIEELCVPDPEKIEMLKLLSGRRYKIYVCSNAVRQTVDLMLTKSELIKYVDFSLSNEDVDSPKPAPEIYNKAFRKAGMNPYECVIVEDSAVGYQSALASGGKVCKVDGPANVNYYRVLTTILEANCINVVIPAGGYGKRFAEAGYQHPKPLIDVAGRPMLSFVLDNLKDLEPDFFHTILVMQKQQLLKYKIPDIFKYEYPMLTFVPEEGLLRGAATGVLQAKELINNDNELIIANSDQVADYRLSLFVLRMRELNADGGMLTFKANNPKWSYAEYNKDNSVNRVAEKIPISDQATVGIYYYKHGKDFVKYAEQMITKNIRTNNEFYVCPVFNEFINAGKRIYIHPIPEGLMRGLGTPEDLQIFLNGPTQ